MKTKLYTIDTEKILAPLGDDTVLCYDTLKIIVAVQGLVNRTEPELYLFWQESDSFWLDYMMQDGKFLHTRELCPIETYDAFLAIYTDFIVECGLCLWDSDVPATMNVATTACGVTSMLPVRYDMRHNSAMHLLIKKTGVRIKENLVGKFTGVGDGSSGSAKCDAYLWALEQYFDQCNPTLLFYTVDGISWDDNRLYYPDLGNAFVPNHDYAISKKAFVFDVSSYDDEFPCDDPTQPLGTDLRTMKLILQRQYDRTKGKEMITICGFNPWQLKYTTYKGKGKHGGVEAEWRFGEILSAYNCIKDADAYGYCGLANASVFTHYPLKPNYTNRQPKPAQQYDASKTYLLFYVGDYDASAWTAKFIPRWYKDKTLGKNPLMWCFNPNLSDRIPMAFDFIYENYTSNDFFEAGDSGAGYNNPRLLYPPRIHSDLPSGVEANVAHNQHYFNQFDLHSIGFLINGNYKTDTTQMYDLSRFATGGVGYNGYGEPAVIVGGTVFMTHTTDIAAESASVDSAVKQALAGIDRCPVTKKFHILRTILVSPSRHDEILQALQQARPQANFELLDPITFFCFAKQAIQEGKTY